MHKRVREALMEMTSLCQHFSVYVLTCFVKRLSNCCLDNCSQIILLRSHQARAKSLMNSRTDQLMNRSNSLVVLGSGRA
jgi:hypothetical protein